MKQEIIPIALLHYDQPEVLLRSVELIYERTAHPFKLFVVDNKSPRSARLSAVFDLLREKFGVSVIVNPKNNWIYGFNLALLDNAWPKANYYAFSDADIYVPVPVNGVCWLSHLVDQMDSSCSIGKLGLTLDLSNLVNNPALKKSLEIESRYLAGPTIGENTVALVDTTMALYRNDFFVTDRFRFQIGHASLAKPQYYTCRASRAYLAYHVGWDYYPDASSFAHSTEKQWAKALAMYRVGAFVAPEILRQFKGWQRISLTVLQKLVKGMHGIKVALLIFIFLGKNFPRNLNEIQAKVRW